MLCRCDNAAVVAIIRSGWSRDPLVMQLMRSLSLFAAVHSVTLMAEHVPWRENVAADAISRGNLDLFFHQVPTGEKEPTIIPHNLLDILVHSQPIDNIYTLTEYILSMVSPTGPPQLGGGSVPIFCSWISSIHSADIQEWGTSISQVVCAHLAKEKLKYRTIKVYLSAIRHLQIAEGGGDPF